MSFTNTESREGTVWVWVVTRSLRCPTLLPTHALDVFEGFRVNVNVKWPSDSHGWNLLERAAVFAANGLLECLLHREVQGRLVAPTKAKVARILSRAWHHARLLRYAA